MPTLTIRRRGTTPAKSSSAPPATTNSTIKGLFHRKTLDTTSRKSIDSTTRKSSLDKSKDTMGNAPSDMNGNGPNGAAKQKPAHLNSASSDRDSVRSRAMPGAEPPTPVPEQAVEKSSDQRSPEPDTVQVQGYDVQAVPHVLSDSPKATEEPDLEAGIPPVGSFEAEEPQHPQPSQEGENPTQAEVADTARTPRAELKTEEGLAPLDLGSLPAHAHHPTEGSDATAVAVSPRALSPPVFAPGTYVLLNARGGTAMDLSGADHKTVIGYPMHGGPNQQWEFIPTGHGYIIRCVRRSPEGHSLYLSTEGGVKHGAAIVASTYPVTWNVEQTEDGMKCVLVCSSFGSCALTTCCVGSCGRTPNMRWTSRTGATMLPVPRYVPRSSPHPTHPNRFPPVQIQLATHRSKEACQHWHYTRCAPAADPKEEKETNSLEAQSARAVSPPATTETITIAEERDFVVTTRTTTTTVITTVTEVTRTPKSMLRQGPQPQRRSIAYR